MNIRTDLAIESREIHGSEDIQGVYTKVNENRDCKATTIEIASAEGARILGKPEGKYITLEMDSLPDSTMLSDGRLELLISSLRELIPEKGTVLAVCLGNTDITPDALGPVCGDRILATRHIPENVSASLKLPSLRSVAVVCPGVSGKTGIETAEIISGIKEKIKPSVIITVDALASRSIKRLGSTVQICNTGIAPGSGVGNKRTEISEKTMGVPVIAIGIPTVVDAETLAYELTGSEITNGDYKNFMITPKDTDIITSSGAAFIALGINCVLQNNLSAEEIISLTSP